MHVKGADTFYVCLSISSRQAILKFQCRPLLVGNRDFHPHLGKTCALAVDSCVAPATPTSFTRFSSCC